METFGTNVDELHGEFFNAPSGMIFGPSSLVDRRSTVVARCAATLPVEHLSTIRGSTADSRTRAARRACEMQRSLPIPGRSCGQP